MSTKPDSDTGAFGKYHVLRFDGSHYSYECPRGLLASGPWELRPHYCTGVCCGRELVEQSTLDEAIEKARASDFEQLIRLREWKESAMTLLSRYDSIADTFGGKLGSSKIDNLERGVARLRKAATLCAIPYEALLVDRESRKWIAPEAWTAIENAVAALREALAHKEEKS